MELERIARKMELERIAREARELGEEIIYLTYPWSFILGGVSAYVTAKVTGIPGLGYPAFLAVASLSSILGGELSKRAECWYYNHYSKHI
jgi:hypothetical protein